MVCISNDVPPVCVDCAISSVSFLALLTWKHIHTLKSDCRKAFHPSVPHVLWRLGWTKSYSTLPRTTCWSASRLIRLGGALQLACVHFLKWIQSKCPAYTLSSISRRWNIVVWGRWNSLPQSFNVATETETEPPFIAQKWKMSQVKTSCRGGDLHDCGVRFQFQPPP